MFKDIDVNKDGVLDTQELVNAFMKLGVKISQSEAVNLIKRMQTNGSLEISFNEFRDYLSVIN